LRVVGQVANLTVDGAEALVKDASIAGNEGSFFLIAGLNGESAKSHPISFTWSADILDSESGQVLAQVKGIPAGFVAAPGPLDIYVDLTTTKWDWTQVSTVFSDSVSPESIALRGGS
jgi:hypothetical protein